jgi:hypothetical protein
VEFGQIRQPVEGAPPKALQSGRDAQYEGAGAARKKRQPHPEAPRRAKTVMRCA